MSTRSSTDSEISEKSQKDLARDALRKQFLVKWDGPGDKANPQNWSLRRKWAATFVIGLYAFFAPISSTMISSSLPTMAADLGIRSQVESILILTVFFLGYSFGVFLLCPLSEVHGRARVIQSASLCNTVFTFASGFATNQAQMMVLRTLTGLGASAVLGISGGVLADTWSHDELGRGLSAYNLATVLSPAVGPIIGGALISSNVSWRWLFWTAAGANATLQLFGIFALQETYGPWILHCKARRLRQSTGNTLLRTEVELNCQRLSHHIAKALKRPWVVLTTQPIIQALSIYSAFLYGLLYIFISSMPTVWMKIYGENQCITGLNYLSVAVGSLIGSQTCAPLNDVLYKILKKRYNYEEGCPEFRIPLMGVGAAGAPIGILIYGWSVWARLHWAVPNTGVFLFALSSNISAQCTQTYIIDAYRPYAYSASAFAASNFLRSLAAFTLPLLAPSLFGVLGLGGAGTLLACVAVALGVPAPLLFWRYGPSLRRKSSYAVGD